MGRLRDGSEISGIEGLRSYLKKHEQKFRRTLCTKLVGYALGRGETIHDVHLIEEMLAELDRDERFGALVEKIVTSRAFRYHRGTDFPVPAANPKGSPTR